MPDFQVPYRRISGLPAKAQEEIRRNFDEVTAGFKVLTSGPWIIVAADGTGDYTSIKTAIEATSSSATTPTTIFVKPGDYTDTSSVAVGGRNVHILADSPSPYASTAQTTWAFQGFTYASTATVTLEGLKISQNGSGNDFAQPSASARLDLTCRSVRFNQWTTGSASFAPTSATGAGTWAFIDSVLPRWRAGTATISITVRALRSTFATTASTTLTCTGAQRYVDCEIEATGANAAWLITHDIMQIESCTFTSGVGSADPQITHRPTAAVATKSARSIFVGNASHSINGGTFTLDLSGTSMGGGTPSIQQGVIGDNSLPAWVITTIGAALPANLLGCIVYISGCYSKLIIGTPGTKADVQLQGLAVPALTITTDKCHVAVAGQGFATATGKGYALTGNTNIVDFAGSSTYPVASTDVGAGNVVRAT